MEIAAPDSIIKGRASLDGSSARRLDYLDGLRGILCCVVVVHHWRCGWHPCSVFGPSVQWLLDSSLSCDSSQTRPFFWLAPFLNGPFAVAVFFVMSGTVLSMPFLNVGTSIDNGSRQKWALAVVKRYFRLAIPVAVALVFSYFVAGFTTVHEKTAQSTQSWWLYNFFCRRPPTVFGLLQQIFVGVWQGSCTLNNAIWTMRTELFGSYLVYLLAGILREIPSPTLAKRLLACLFLFMLVPSNTELSRQSVRLDWMETSSGTNSNIVMQRVKLNPVSHAALLEQLNVPLTIKQVTKKTTLVDSSEAEGSIVSESPPRTLDDNLPLLNRLLHGEQERHYTLQELQYSKVFGPANNPWTWYAGFVSGIFIAVDMTTTTAPANAPLWVDALEILAAYLCATYPYAAVWTQHNIIWRSMHTVTETMMLGSSNSLPFWHIIGASCLVHFVVRRHQLLNPYLCHPICLWLGKISFALYLIHIPIVFTLTCWLYNKLRVANNTPWTHDHASLMALLLSIPAMLLIAWIFHLYVDRPAIRLSSITGKKIMGIEQHVHVKKPIES